MKNVLLYSKNTFFAISFLVFFGSIYMYISFKGVIHDQQTKIHHIEVNRAHKTAKTIMPQINLHSDNSIKNILYDGAVEPELSRILSYYRNDEFKYIYLVSVDNKGTFRYLADGSVFEEKAAFQQKFTPILESLWSDVLKEKKDVYAIQDNVEGLWLTYLSPIIEEGQVKAILVLDISTKEYQEFFKLLVPLKNFLNLFLFVLSIVFIIVLSQGFLFYKQYKNSMFDALTKLHNRHFLTTISHTFFTDKLSILLIDIDFFKLVNDKYGHDIGDKVLETVARKLLAATRLDDKVIRYGGEEFLVLIKSVEDKKKVLKIAERIRASIEKDPIRINDSLNINITVSIGANLSVKSFCTMEKAIKKADEMLYQAKNSGRNKVVSYKD